MGRLNARIATSEAGLAKGALFARGIPVPQMFYRDHSSRSAQGEGGETLHGYKAVTLLWENLTASQAAALRDMIDTAQAAANGLIYLTILRNDAANGNYDWIDVSGRPSMPEWNPAYDGHVYAPVEMVVNNLTILNDPSTYN